MGAKCYGRTWFKVHVSPCFWMEEEIPLHSSTWCWRKVFTGLGQPNQTLTRPGRHLLCTDQPWAQTLVWRTHTLFLPLEEDYAIQRPLASLPAGFSTHQDLNAPPCHSRLTHEDTPTLSIRLWQRNWVCRHCRRRTTKVRNDLTPGSTASTSMTNPSVWQHGWELWFPGLILAVKNQLHWGLLNSSSKCIRRYMSSGHTHRQAAEGKRKRGCRACSWWISNIYSELKWGIY